MKTWFAIDGTLEPIEDAGPSFFRFPQEVAERVLLRYSSVGEWVFDPFCGFGTTLVVAERLGRHAVGFEKEAERARFVARRITAPTRVINATIFHLCQYDLPPFPVRFTGLPSTTLREWDTDGFTQYLEDLRSSFTLIRTVMQPSATLIVEVCNAREAQHVRPVVWEVGHVVAQWFHFEGEIACCNTGPEPAGPGFDHSYLLVFTCGGRE